MYIVEVIEKSEVLSEECIADSFERGLHLSSDESVDVLSRKVVGIFRDRDRAEKCRRLQPEFVEDRQSWEPQVVIREIDSDF